MNEGNRKQLLSQVAAALQMFGPMNSKEIKAKLKLRSIMIEDSVLSGLLKEASDAELREHGIQRADISDTWKYK